MIIDLNNLVINLNENNFKTIAVAKTKKNAVEEAIDVVRIDFIDKTSVCLASPTQTPEGSLELLQQIKEGLIEHKEYLKLSTFPKIEN